MKLQTVGQLWNIRNPSLVHDSRIFISMAHAQNCETSAKDTIISILTWVLIRVYMCTFDKGNTNYCILHRRARFSVLHDCF